MADKLVDPRVKIAREAAIPELVRKICDVIPAAVAVAMPDVSRVRNINGQWMIVVDAGGYSAPGTPSREPAHAVRIPRPTTSVPTGEEETTIYTAPSQDRRTVATALARGESPGEESAEEPESH